MHVHCNHIESFHSWINFMLNALSHINFVYCELGILYTVNTVSINLSLDSSYYEPLTPLLPLTEYILSLWRHNTLTPPFTPIRHKLASLDEIKVAVEARVAVSRHVGLCRTSFIEKHDWFEYKSDLTFMLDDFMLYEERDIEIEGYDITSRIGESEGEKFKRNHLSTSSVHMLEEVKMSVENFL